MREEVPDLESSQMKETLWISEQDHSRSRRVVPTQETTSHSHPTSLSQHQTMLDKLGAFQDKSEDENRKERTEEYLSREK